MTDNGYIIVIRDHHIITINISTQKIETINITADSATINPSTNTLAFKSKQTLQIIDIKTQNTITCFNSIDPILFFKWLNSNTLAFITSKELYHWYLNSGHNPEKKTDIIQQNITATYVNYEVSTCGDWSIFQSISKAPTDHSIEGSLKLYNLKSNRYTTVSAFGSCFISLSINNHHNTILCIAKKENNNSCNIKLLFTESTKHFKRETEIYLEHSDDYIIAIVSCVEYGCVYIVSYHGYIILVDIETAHEIATISTSNIRLLSAVKYFVPGSMVTLDTNGIITLYTIDKNDYVPYLIKRFHIDIEKAQIIALKYNLPFSQNKTYHSQLIEQSKLEHKQMIEQIIKDAEKYKDEDNKKKVTIQSKNELEQLAYSIRNILVHKKYRRLIDDIDKQKIRDLIEEIIDWVDENPNAEKHEYDEKMQFLEEYWNTIIDVVDENSSWRNVCLMASMPSYGNDIDLKVSEQTKDIQYYATLLQNGVLNKDDSIGFCEEILKYKDGDTKITECFKGNRLTISEELGDVLKDIGEIKLAAHAFYICKTHFKLIECFIELGNPFAKNYHKNWIDSIIRYCEMENYTFKWFEILRKVNKKSHTYNVVPFVNKLITKQYVSEYDIMNILTSFKMDKSTIMCLTKKHTKDLIISGWIRKIETKLLMNIHDDIIAILIEFYEYNCDLWDIENSNSVFEIQDNCIKLKQESIGFHTIFGSNILTDNSCYEWRLKIVKHIKYLYLGIICDYNFKFEKHKYKNAWNWYVNNSEGKYGGYVFNLHDEKFYCSNNILKYGSMIKSNVNDGDLIEMKVDLRNDNSSICFTINGKDYGIAYDKIEKKYNYRLAVCIYKADNAAEIQLI